MHLKLRENNNFEKLHPLNGEVFNFIHHFLFQRKVSHTESFCKLHVHFVHWYSAIWWRWAKYQLNKQGGEKDKISLNKKMRAPFGCYKVKFIKVGIIVLQIIKCLAILLYWWLWNTVTSDALFVKCNWMYTVHVYLHSVAIIYQAKIIEFIMWN